MNQIKEISIVNCKILINLIQITKKYKILNKLTVIFH